MAKLRVLATASQKRYIPPVCAQAKTTPDLKSDRGVSGQRRALKPLSRGWRGCGKNAPMDIPLRRKGVKAFHQDHKTRPVRF